MMKYGRNRGMLTVFAFFMFSMFSMLFSGCAISERESVDMGEVKMEEVSSQKMEQTGEVSDKDIKLEFLQEDTGVEDTQEAGSDFDEIKKQAQDYFNEKFEKGNFFFDDAITNKERDRYQMASFYLHQSCENYYYAIRLTFTLRNNKQHNLSKLSSTTRRYSDDLSTVFPQNTLEEKRLFKLLKAAYVDARYNPHFVVTKEDIDALIPKVELLRDITKRICEAKIKEYGEQSGI